MSIFQAFNYRERLAVAGQALGLQFDGDRQLQGRHNGIDVGVRLYTESSGSGSNRSTSYYTHVHALHRAPLRMGLSLSRSSLLGWNLTGRRREISIGHPAFDSRFHVAAFDADRAWHFLQDPQLVDTLLGIDTSRFRDRGLNVSDAASSITLTRWETDAADLVPHLDSVHRVAWQINRRRDEVPRSADEERAARAFTDVGRRRGLAFDEDSLTLSGPLLSNTVEVEAHYGSDGGWTTIVEARFPQSLGLGLQLLKDHHGFFSKVGEFFGSQDIEVGHEQLDHAFKVKGKPDHVVAELLRGEVADRILALKAVAKSCKVSDEGVRAVADGILSDAGALDRSIEVVGELAAAMHRRAQGGMSSPYR